jgi:hypothetical protein
MARRKKGRTTSKAGIQLGPFAPWMKQYALWLAGQPEAELAAVAGSGDRRKRYPTTAERLLKINKLVNRSMNKESLKLLERRDDVVKYFNELRENAAKHARELALEQMPDAFEARRLGLKKAVDKQINPETGEGECGADADLRAIHNLTAPFMDLALPKKDAQAPPPQRFTINLFGVPEEQKKLILKSLIEDEPDVIEYEVIPNERQLGSGETDD